MVPVYSYKYKKEREKDIKVVVYLLPVISILFIPYGYMYRGDFLRLLYTPSLKLSTPNLHFSEFNCGVWLCNLISRGQGFLLVNVFVYCTYKRHPP